MKLLEALSLVPALVVATDFIALSLAYILFRGELRSRVSPGKRLTVDDLLNAISPVSNVVMTFAVVTAVGILLGGIF